MAEFDSNVADISAILDAYMYLNYQVDPEHVKEKKPVRRIRVLENIHWSVRAIMSMRQMDRISSIIQEKNVQMIQYRHVHSKVLTEIYMWHTEEPVLKDGEITDRGLWMNPQICRKLPEHTLTMLWNNMDMKEIYM